MLTDTGRFEPVGSSIVLVSKDRMKNRLREDSAIEVVECNDKEYARCPYCNGAAELVDRHATLRGYVGSGQAMMFSCCECGRAFAQVLLDGD